MKVCFICQYNTKLHFLNPHALRLKELGHQNIFFYIDKDNVGSISSRRGVTDLPKLLYDLFFFIKFNKPDRLVSITPKAGFLATIINLYFKISHIHWFTGQVWCNDRFIKRYIKSFPDRVINLYVKKILVDSKPQLNYLIQNNFNKKKMRVLGLGSINGVDNSIRYTKRYIKKNKKKVKLGIVGRLCEEKGIDFLLNFIQNETYNYRLFEFHFYGEFDDGQKILERKFYKLRSELPEIIFWHGNIKSKNKIYQNIDILLLPSFREGFSNVLIEAQYAGIPVIARKIYAIKETFIEKKTGYFFNSHQDLIKKILKLSNDNYLYEKFSIEAHKYISKNFNRKKVVDNVVNYYISN